MKGAALAEILVFLQSHGGTGSPDYGAYKVSLPIRLVETGWFSTRSYTHMLLSGVFERFPTLRTASIENGACSRGAITTWTAP